MGTENKLKTNLIFEKKFFKFLDKTNLKYTENPKYLVAKLQRGK
jgi:hypothetical protein